MSYIKDFPMNWLISFFYNCIKITSETEDKVIMGIKHKEYPIYGVQFHPEAEMTEEGHKILNNFIKITKEFSNENKKC